jgi:tRNA uridine 5-carboxymethylaminomethyl modification enzyme
MFTSAAEHRLLLRADNADDRLAAHGFALGLLDAAQLEHVHAGYAALAAEERRLGRVSVRVPSGVPGGAERSVRAVEYLSRPEGTFAGLAGFGVESALAPRLCDALEVRLKYRGYIERQARTAAASAALERVRLAESLWDAELSGLSREAREKLRRWRPANVAQAARIAGVSPADVGVLLVYAKRHDANGGADHEAARDAAREGAHDVAHAGSHAGSHDGSHDGARGAARDASDEAAHATAGGPAQAAAPAVAQDAGEDFARD